MNRTRTAATAFLALLAGLGLPASSSPQVIETNEPKHHLGCALMRLSVEFQTSYHWHSRIAQLTSRHASAAGCSARYGARCESQRCAAHHAHVA